jgi:molecular chaperone DnaK (HSP70)
LAAKEANLDVKLLVFEPLAAAFLHRFCSESSQVHEKVVVFDFSSESLTVLIVAKDKGNYTLVDSVKAFLGGRDFDCHLANWCLKNHALKAFDPKSMSYGQWHKLMVLCCETKRNLLTSVADCITIEDLTQGSV